MRQRIYWSRIEVKLPRQLGNKQNGACGKFIETVARLYIQDI